MKNTFLTILILSFTIISCDVPQRVPDTTNVTIDGSQNTGSGFTGSGQDSSSNTNTTGNNQSASGVDSTPGFEHCTNSTDLYASSIGSFSLCNHSDTNNDSQYRVYFNSASTTGTCFVPAHRLNNGSSFKLGIAQCVHNQANTPYYMTLNKEMAAPYFNVQRPEPINTVMVLSADAVNAYMACMSAKESYMIANRVVPGNYATAPCCNQVVNNSGRLYCLSTNSQCESAANTYAQSVCQNFAQNYSGKYKQVNF